ncbi:F0F1 ATP synthase subunit C [Stieleria mannarensis]|uniref:F0F1 ATP synthase subunit C n=1 Tax=Stieleria mannarensis TaxID=2755585 RepID=UPI001C71C950|nr:F0F1 ATP synthase subunit C [Rhodopirellula sp. JC639]
MNSHRAASCILTAVIVFAVTGICQQAAPAQGPATAGAVTQSPADPRVTPDDSAAVTAAHGGIDNLGLIALGSIVVAGLTIAIGSVAPAIGEGRAVAQALNAIAQQPDSSNTITRTLFVGLAMIESTAIYCFVVAMIVLFANPFWNHFTQ